MLTSLSHCRGISTSVLQLLSLKREMKTTKAKLNIFITIFPEINVERLIAVDDKAPDLNESQIFCRAYLS